VNVRAAQQTSQKKIWSVAYLRRHRHECRGGAIERIGAGAAQRYAHHKHAAISVGRRLWQLQMHEEVVA
jgi:hypothetical protein